MRVLAAELALKAHCAFNLSKLTLRVAFARYALSAPAGRRAQSFVALTVKAFYCVRLSFNNVASSVLF
ncbi:hypothetical protein CG398_03860 [Bifidobacteriaceae bacterium NR003]|nr:hypothetical protein CG398_03860 [Bifidobacteriaceae bacterium NR003]